MKPRRSAFRFPVSTLAGSPVGNIPDLIRGHTIEPPYRFKFILSCLAAGIFEPLNRYESWRYRKQLLQFNPESPPLFIIGFWRSGTTLLHNLLCQDPAAAYTTTFQTVFPNIFLSQSWWLKPIVNAIVPAQRPYDNVSMDMDFPQEEDFGLMNLQPWSIYKFFLFPADFDKILSRELFTGNLPPRQREQWKEAYRQMMAKAVINTGGTRYIGKNPCHLTRTGLLREMFPDARFIFIHRHPYKVAESLYHFILSIFPGVQLQGVPDTFTRESVVRMYKTIMDVWFTDRETIPPENLIEVRMDELTRDMHGTLSGIYKRFDLGDYSVVYQRFNRFMQETPAPRQNPHPPTAETLELINSRAGDIMKKLGYTDPVS